MRKIEREYRQLASQCGFGVLEIESRNGHYALVFEAGRVWASGTPSDCRNRVNVLAQIRRLHCG